MTKTGKQIRTPEPFKKPEDEVIQDDIYGQTKEIVGRTRLDSVRHLGRRVKGKSKERTWNIFKQLGLYMGRPVVPSPAIHIKIQFMKHIGEYFCDLGRESVIRGQGQLRAREPTAVLKLSMRHRVKRNCLISVFQCLAAS